MVPAEKWLRRGATEFALHHRVLLPSAKARMLGGGECEHKPLQEAPKSISSLDNLGNQALSHFPVLLICLSLQACVTQYMPGLINPISLSLSKGKESPSNDQYPYCDDKQRQMSLWGLAGICNYCLCRHSITANERVTGPSLLPDRGAFVQAPWHGL